MRTLITGATGFVGRHVVNTLLSGGHTVRAMGRNSEMLAALKAQGCETFMGDLLDEKRLGGAVEGIEGIVHCVGIIMEPKGVSFESIVRDGTLNLVQNAVKAGVRRIVYVSAMGVRANAKSRYHQTKWDAEEMIRRSGMEYVILRPSIIFGPEDKFIQQFLSMPVIPLPNAGAQKYQPIYVDDLAQIIQLSLETEGLLNKTVDAGGPVQLSFKEIMQTAIKVSGKRKPFASAPMFLMGALSKIADPMQKISPALTPLTKDQFLMMQEDNIGDNTQLTQAFPNLKLTSLEEGLRKYMGTKK